MRPVRFLLYFVQTSLLLLFLLVPQVMMAATAAQDGGPRPDLPDNVRARTLLSSQDTVEQAWGAWLAAEGGHTELTALIEERLAAQIPRLPTQGTIAIDTMSDALIRLNAKPPATLLQPLWNFQRAEVLILLARLGPEANDVLLGFISRSDDLDWAGAANLLLANHAPSFAASLLRGLNLRAELVVCSPESVCGKSTGGLVRGMGIADGPTARSLPGLPPWPAYTLARQGSSLLADGPISVSYSRAVNREGLPPRPSSFRFTPITPTDRLNYISAAAPGVAIGIQEYEQRRTVWKDDETVATEKESFRKDILGRYTAFLQQLIAAKVLSTEEAKGLETPRLDLRVVPKPRLGIDAPALTK